MTFVVRIHAYRGMVAVPAVPAAHPSDKLVLAQPYEWGEALLMDGPEAKRSKPNTVHDQVHLLVVEVPKGACVRYEIGPSGQCKDADALSPALWVGEHHIQFGPGWVISMIDGMEARVPVA